MADAKEIDKLIDRYKQPFVSCPTYTKAGDCVELYFEDVDCFAERVDCWLTVYRAFEGKKVVGFMLKNVGALLSAFDSLGLKCRVEPSSCTIYVYGMVEKMPWVNSESAKQSSYRDILSSLRERQTETVDLVTA